jgi:hypothetical protein
MMLVKWSLFLGTLPYVFAVMAVRLGLQHAFGFNGLVDFGDLATVLTAGVFLIGFMLSGVMSDYKESEKLPAELACSLENLANHIASARMHNPGKEVDAAVASYKALYAVIIEWLHRKKQATDVLDAINVNSNDLRILDPLSKYAGSGLKEMGALRKIVVRIYVISRTNFLDSGYALLELLVATVLVSAVVAKFHSTLTEYILLTVLPLVYVYMYRLIRDLDDPFEYSHDGKRGAAEVDLFPITEAEARVQRILADRPAG